ncbi:MAG: trypsin-like peptidase domain-containing protein [Chitinophagales bacterium]
MNRLILTMIVSVITSLLTIFVCFHWIGFQTEYHSYAALQSGLVQKTNYNSSENVHRVYENTYSTDFIRASKIASPTVVSITKVKNNSSQHHEGFPGYLDNKNNGRTWNESEISSGSGVIVSSDGYIVTNYHVVEGSDEIKVNLYNKESYTATIIGIDPSTDVALIKINAFNLPAIKYGDSDRVEVGEWVLAVGNPFNLTSTVTAGIISAKARNINILEEEYAIESFIQTDAVINSGNSGGALVNTRGELVALNTAIATPYQSGTYAGYSFAIPVNIVRKVVDDLRTHGMVQRAYLGVNIKNIDSELAKEMNLQSMNGVYVEQVIKGSAAHDAGLKKGDIIIEVHGRKVNSSPELDERLARYRPGNPISITYLRNGIEEYVQVTLKSINHQTDIVKDIHSKDNIKQSFGAEFEQLAVVELKRMGLKNGIRVTRLMDNGVLKNNTEMQPDFIILKFNDIDIYDDKQLHEVYQEMEKGDRIQIEGIYSGSKRKTVYAFSIR